LSIRPDFEYELVRVVLTRPHRSVNDFLRMTSTKEVLSVSTLLEDAHLVVGLGATTLLGHILRDLRFGSPEYRYGVVYPDSLDLMAVS
jgi:hypothetical protein